MNSSTVTDSLIAKINNLENFGLTMDNISFL